MDGYWVRDLKTQRKQQMVGAYLADCPFPVQIGYIFLVSTPGKQIFHTYALGTNHEVWMVRIQ